MPDYDSLAKQLGGSAQEDDYDRLAKTMGGSSVPQVSHVPTRDQIVAQHQHNLRMGEADEADKSGSWIAPVTNSIAAVPRVLGTVSQSVPLVGVPLGMLGETAAQGIEMAGGTRANFSPGEVIGQGVLGAIPGGFMVRSLKPTSRIAAKGLGALEGAAVGTTSASVPALSRGELPSASDLGTGLGLGAVMGGITGSGSQVRQAEPRPDTATKAHNMLYDAIRPAESNTREFSEHLNTALPYIYANRKGYVNSIGDMEQAAKGTMRRLWDLHIEPVVAMNSYAPTDTSHVAEGLMSKINRDTPPAVAKAITREAQKYVEPRTLSDLNRRIKELNAETRGLQEASGKTARTLRTDPKTAWKFDQLNLLRDTLADEAGKITGSGEMYMKLRKDWGALSEVAEASEDAAKRWEHQQKIESASFLPGVQRLTKAVKGGLGFGSTAAIRRGATELVSEYMSNPDRRVRGAFKQLRFGQRLSEQFPEPQVGPERKALPAMGETGEPSLGDMQYRLPEDRAAGKRARQRQEGSRLLTGQTREDFANQPAPGEPAPLQPGEMDLSPGQVPSRPSAARPTPITIAPPPDMRVSGLSPSKPRIRVQAGRAPVQGQTVPITVSPVPEPPTTLGSYYSGPERRRSILSPEEAAQEQIARRIERRKGKRPPLTIGEAASTPGATISDQQNFRFHNQNEVADFLENIDRNKP